MDRRIYTWLSGLFAGAAIGTIAPCPAKLISVPLSLILAAVFGYLGREKQTK